MKKQNIVDLPLGARFSYEPQEGSDIWVLLNKTKKCSQPFNSDKIAGLICSWVRSGIRVDQRDRQEFCCITNSDGPNIEDITVYWID